MIRINDEIATKNRDEVLSTIIELTMGNEEINPYETSGRHLYINKTHDGVTSYEINQHINQKYERIRDDQIKDLDARYEKGDIDKKERDLREEYIKENNSFNIRTIQRVLKFLIAKELVYKQDNKYYVTDNCKYSIQYSSSSFGSELLFSIMKLHNPYLNTLGRNVEELIMMFGSYVFLSLLEAARPLDDHYFLSRKNQRLTTSEKNIFTEKWLRDVINVPLLYKFFLETFLNQPDDKTVEGIVKVRFKETRRIKNQLKYIYTDSNGKEYDHLYGIFYEYRYIDKEGKEVSPSIFDQNRVAVPVSISPIIRFYNTFPFPGKPYDIIYELNNELYEKIREKISENYPAIYNRSLDIGSGDVRGAKNNNAAGIYNKIKRNKK